MNVIQSAVALLRRPIADPADARPGAAGRRKAVPGPAEPVTEEELRLKLRELNELEASARATIANAGAEQERLVAAGAEFEELKQVRESIDRATHDLERIALTRPAFVRAITKCVRQRERADWIPVRDETVAFLRRRMLPAIAAYRAALAEWRAKYEEVVAQYPQATEVLPLAPSLYDGGRTFDSQIDTFATRILIPDTRPPPAFLRSLASAIEFSCKTGTIPDDILPEWRPEIERAMNGEASVKLNVSIIDSQGRSVAAGTTLVLPYDDADRHVRAGRAVYA